MGQSRRVEADIVAHIAEVDQRRLYAREAFPSMFTYCTDLLHLSEPQAYLRIAVARASREHPMLLPLLADGRLHLTAIGMLAPYLTRENRDGLLERAIHRSKRQIEELIAEIAPRPDVPTVVRRLPERRTLPAAGPLPVPNLGMRSMIESGLNPAVAQLRPDGVGASEPAGLRDEAIVSRDALNTHAPAMASSPVTPSVVQPLSPGRYKVQFTASAVFHDKLKRLQALVPGADLAAALEQAVTERLERLEARRFARTKAPRKGLVAMAPVTAPARTPARAPSSRHIPAAIRRAVYERDGDRCAYVDDHGRRCPQTDRLEYHHRHPFGLGGKHGVANVALVCPAHNAYLAECDYGREAMARHRPPRGPASPPPDPSFPR
jgi:hypothetical protein